MKFALFVILLFAPFFTINAARVNLTKYEENFYLMEVRDTYSAWSGEYDSTDKILKDIAIAVRKKGCEVFLIPPLKDWISSNKCGVYIFEEYNESIKAVATAYGYKTWVAKNILGY